MSQHTVLDLDLGPRDAPGLRGRLLQALARAGASLQKRLHASRLRGAGEEGIVIAARRLGVEVVLDVVALGRGVFAANPLPVTVQLLGDRHQCVRHHAVTDIGCRHPHSDSVVRTDRDPGRELGTATGRQLPRICSRGSLARFGNTQHEAAAHSRYGDQEVAPILLHGVLLRPSQGEQPCESRHARGDRCRNGRCC